MEIIDLRSSSYSNIAFIDHKNSIEHLSINYFESQIQSLKEFFEKDKLFLLTNLSSRSIHLNKVARLALFEKILANYPKEKKTFFIVDSYIEKKILDSLITSKNHKVIRKTSIKDILSKLFFENIFINFLKSFYLTFFFFVGSIYMNQKIYKKKINFISRNYHISSNINNKYKCRYFGNPIKFLPNEDFYNLYNLYDIYNLSALKKIKKNLDNNSFFVELNLSLGDYFSALAISLYPSWMSLRLIISGKKNLKNFYFFLLLFSETFSTSILRNLFQLKFYKRLQKNHSQIISFFDWYEGLPLNTAKIIGVKKHFPSSNFVGHFGSTGEIINPSNSISSFDEKLKINPDIISFKANIFYKNALRNIDFKIKAIEGPDFRFRHNEIDKIDINKKKNLCIVLPYYDKEALSLVRFYKTVSKNKVSIKLHPSAKYSQTKKFLRLNKHLFNEIIESPLDSGIFTHILTLGSGLSFEAYVRGMVVGILTTSNFYTLNHLENVAKLNEYKIIKDKESFDKFMKMHQAPNKEIKHLYNQVNEYSIKKYFL